MFLPAIMWTQFIYILTTYYIFKKWPFARQKMVAHCVFEKYRVCPQHMQYVKINSRWI